MLPQVFQYQARAEPLRDLTGAATVDKWLGDFPDRPQRRPFAIAVLVAGMVAPVAPPVSVASWQGSATVPGHTAPRQGGHFAVDPTPLRTVTVNDWLGFDEYRRPAPKPVLWPSYASPTTLVASAEVITLDKWLWTWPQPDRTRHPINPASGGKLPDRASPTVDVATWYTIPSQPAPKAKPQLPGGVNVLTPIAGVDSWQGVQSVPQPTRVRATGGTFAPVYVPAAVVDNGPLDWLGFASQPRQRRGQAQPGSGGQFVIQPILVTAPTPTVSGYLVLQQAGGILPFEVLG